MKRLEFILMIFMITVWIGLTILYVGKLVVNRINENNQQIESIIDSL